MSAAARVVLRPVEETDFRRLVAWECDPSISIQFGKTFSSLGDYRKYRNLLVRGRRYGMAVVLDTGRLIGYAELVNIAWRSRSGELCMLIGEEADRGRGYGTAALRQFLHTAFGRLALDRVFLRVGESNVRARRCYRRCGFQIRARLAVTARQPDRTEALLLMELLREEWLVPDPETGRVVVRDAERAADRDCKSGHTSPGFRSGLITQCQLLSRQILTEV